MLFAVSIKSQMVSIQYLITVSFHLQSHSIIKKRKGLEFLKTAGLVVMATIKALLELPRYILISQEIKIGLMTFSVLVSHPNLIQYLCPSSRGAVT